MNLPPILSKVSSSLVIRVSFATFRSCSEHEFSNTCFSQDEDEALLDEELEAEEAAMAAEEEAELIRSQKRDQTANVDFYRSSPENAAKWHAKKDANRAAKSGLPPIVAADLGACVISTSQCQSADETRIFFILFLV